MSHFRFLQRGWKESLSRLFGSARREILICSPYITHDGTQFVEQTISEKFQKDGRCTVITNLTPTNVLQGATDPHALQHLSDAVPNFALWHLPRLHAKIYIADTRSAIVTSANLTYGGVEGNYEYGVHVDDEEVVGQIRQDIIGYGELGARLSNKELSGYVDVANAVKAAFQRQQRTITKSARVEFERLLHKAENNLISLRLSGASRTQVFERTVEYLLGRHGSMTTSEIHSKIAAIHPDLCDDSVDRVINGRHFGKRWKHAVRTAQNHLKSADHIELVGDRWQLVNRAS